MTISGYAGKVLFVDLSSRTYIEKSSEEYVDWIGGRGLGAYLLSLSKNIYDEELINQPIVISAGPLVASGIPLGCRTSISARNQISKGFCYSNVGGDFGARLKMAGFDAIIINGRSEYPVYLYLDNTCVEFKDARVLWGTRMSELRNELNHLHQGRELSYIGIGPAGENRVAISCLIVDEAHAAGWGGSGAIFGAKKLKAIVAVGKNPVAVYNPEGLTAKARQLEWRMNASEAMAGLVRGGTHGVAAAGGFSGLVPTGVKNLIDEYLTPQDSAPIREENFRQWETGRSGCFRCHIKCLHRYRLPSTDYGVIEAEGIHANSVRGLGSNLGINSPDDLLLLHQTVNEYGLDVDGVSSALAFALECAEHGILDNVQPGGVKLEWGNGCDLVKLVKQIALNEDFGKILGKGIFEASNILGEESKPYAMTTKRVGINEQGIRSHRSWAIGVLVSTRGGGHLGGSPQAENRQVSKELGDRIFGNPLAGNPGAYDGKGRMSAFTEISKVIVDSLGVCYFGYGWYDISLGNVDEMAEMLYLATGLQKDGGALIKFGARVHTLERYMSNLLAGYDRKDDTVPERFFNTPVSCGPYQDATLNHSEIEKELESYYEYLGWDVATGVPSAKILRESGLAYLLEKM